MREALPEECRWALHALVDREGRPLPPGAPRSPEFTQAREHALLRVQQSSAQFSARRANLKIASGGQLHVARRSREEASELRTWWDALVEGIAACLREETEAAELARAAETHYHSIDLTQLALGTSFDK